MEPATSENTVKFSKRIFASPFGTRCCAGAGFKRPCEKTKLGLAKFGVTISHLVPGNRLNIETPAQLRKNLAGHPLHSGVLRRTARAGDVDEKFHSAGTCQQMNWARASCTSTLG